MFDLVTPLQNIGSLRLDAEFALSHENDQAVLLALNDIQDICDKALTDLNRLALIAGTGKEPKT